MKQLHTLPRRQWPYGNTFFIRYYAARWAQVTR